MVKQLSVFLENTKGRLAHMTQVLADADIDLLALSIADTTDFGILRAIVSDLDGAVKALKDAQYTVSTTEVLAILVADVPGGLARVLKILDDVNVSVEYLYSFVRRSDENALILFKVDKLDEARSVLAAQGIELISQEALVKI